MKSERLHIVGAAALLLASAGLAWYGQPTPTEKWRFMASELQPRLDGREVQIEPAELLALMHNDYIDLHLIDVRDEREWNLFHLWGAERIPKDALTEYQQRFANLPENGVIVFLSDNETRATDAWKQVMATAQQPNAYILAGGIDRWLAQFSGDAARQPTEPTGEADATPRYPFTWALGSRHAASLPDPHDVETHEFVKKVKLQKRVVKKGGCG